MPDRPVSVAYSIGARMANRTAQQCAARPALPVSRSILSISVDLSIQVHPYATCLHNPKLPINWPGSRERKKLSQPSLKQCSGRGCPQFQNNNSCTRPGWEARYLPEVAVQRHQHAAFRRARLKQSFVGGAGQALLPNGHRVVTGLPQDDRAASADIFIDFYLQAAGSTETGITRSRAASAP